MVTSASVNELSKRKEKKFFFRQAHWPTSIVICFHVSLGTFIHKNATLFWCRVLMYSDSIWIFFFSFVFSLSSDSEKVCGGNREKIQSTVLKTLLLIYETLWVCEMEICVTRALILLRVINFLWSKAKSLSVWKETTKKKVLLNLLTAFFTVGELHARQSTNSNSFRARVNELSEIGVNYPKFSIFRTFQIKINRATG